MKTPALSRRSLLKTAAAAGAAASVPTLASSAALEPAAETGHIRNFDMIEAFYREYPKKLAAVRGHLGRPLTLAEKILYTHLYHPEEMREFKRGADYVELRPDRAGTHDIGGPMAIIQFLSSGKDRIALPAAIVCDHLVMANAGAIPDLKVADKSNYETYDFLARAAKRYGFDFWPAGAGICHQVFLENYNFPGGMMLVTDSHTPTAGGLGMLAIGVGGADLVDGLMGMEWELKMPKLIGVKLTGRLQGWASPKDVILKLTGILSTKGGTNAIIEFFGEGTESLSATGKATICNMGAETGATTSIFPFDAAMERYLVSTGRQAVVDLARGVAIGVIIDCNLYYGKSGFAGEFGHTPYFDNEIICDCGKKGCLETEVSGIAIENKMIQQIKNGRTTILMDKYQKQHKIHINDIIQAAKNDDTLSIELIEEAGEKIGKSIAFLINIFNPEQVIIGGNLANAGDYLMLPLKSAVNKYSLRLVYNDTLFRTTNLDDNIGSLGAAMLIRNKVISL